MARRIGAPARACSLVGRGACSAAARLAACYDARAVGGERRQDATHKKFVVLKARRSRAALSRCAPFDQTS